MNNWREGYEADWRFMSVNPVTWVEETEVPYVRNFSFNTDGTDDVPLLQSGSIESLLPAGNPFETGWYQVQLRPRFESGYGEMVPIATLLFEQTSGFLDLGFDTATVKGQSVLKPVADKKLQAGEYISPGENGVTWIYQHMQKATPAPILFNGNFTVEDYHVWDGGTPLLKAVWELLDAAGWVMQIRGDGRIVIKPKDYTPVLDLDTANASVLMPGVGYNQDISEVPNVYYAIQGDTVAVAVNDDPNSITSTVYRGYEKETYDSNVIRINGESLEEYAARMLEASSTIMKTYSYSREFQENGIPFDYVHGNLPGIFEDEVLMILSQTYNTSHGIQISETSGREVKLWQRR